MDTFYFSHIINKLSDFNTCFSSIMLFPITRFLLLLRLVQFYFFGSHIIVYCQRFYCSIILLYTFSFRPLLCQYHLSYIVILSFFRFSCLGFLYIMFQMLKCVELFSMIIYILDIVFISSYNFLLICNYIILTYSTEYLKQYYVISISTTYIYYSK